MNQDQMLGNAFALRESKPWELLDEKQIFAIQTGDEICYAQVFGMYTERKGLIATIGQQGRIALLRFFEEAFEDNHLEMMAASHAINAVKCLFTSRDLLDRDELEAVRAYKKAKNITIRGADAWPILSRTYPQHAPVMITEDADRKTLSDAIAACSWLARNMEEKRIRIPEFTDVSGTIVCLRPEKDGYAVDEIRLEELPPVQYPVGYTDNELAKEKVKRMAKKGKWACELLSSPGAATADNYEGYIYPWHLLTLRMDNRELVDVQPVRDYENRTNVMLDKLMEAIIRENTCPSAITVSDPRTREFLKDWCAGMKIKLQNKEKPREFLEVERQFGIEEPDDSYDEEEEKAELEDIERLMDLLLSIPDQYMHGDRRLMGEGMQLLEQMKTHPSVPELLRVKVGLLQEKLNKLNAKEADAKGKRKTKSKEPEKSYVISVSLGTGCYRHIQISSRAELLDLSVSILNAFDFLDDHAHAFFMDNRTYSHKDCYYMKGIDPYYPTTDKTSLEEAGLTAGMKFKYLFDFGDDWTFQCRVLKELDEITTRPAIVRSKGEAPSQYPDWDDYEDDEGWEDEDWDEDE